MTAVFCLHRFQGRLGTSILQSRKFTAQPQHCTQCTVANRWHALPQTGNEGEERQTCVCGAWSEAPGAGWS